MLRAIQLDRYFLFYIIHRGEMWLAQDRVRQVFPSDPKRSRTRSDWMYKMQRCGLISIYNRILIQFISRLEEPRLRKFKSDWKFNWMSQTFHMSRQMEFQLLGYCSRWNGPRNKSENKSKKLDFDLESRKERRRFKAAGIFFSGGRKSLL